MPMRSFAEVARRHDVRAEEVLREHVVRRVLDEAVALEAVELDLPAGALARPRDLGLAERVARDLRLAPRLRQQVSHAVALHDRDDRGDGPRVDAHGERDVADARVDDQLVADTLVRRIVEPRDQLLRLGDAHARMQLREPARGRR
jgi:hypothetical protein